MPLLKRCKSKPTRETKKERRIRMLDRQSKQLRRTPTTPLLMHGRWIPAGPHRNVKLENR